MTASLPFVDRDDAARQLARALAHFGQRQPVVLAIPRGAVPMGRIIADALDGELDVVLVRKLGAPGHSELAIGAVDERGQVFLSEVAQLVGAGEAYVDQEARRQLALIHERRQVYRAGRPSLPLAGRTVIVVDDGLATGATMSAALRMARLQDPAHLVCAVPVASRDSLAQVASLADDVVCLAAPRDFQAVGQFYLSFPSIEDEEVIATLAQAAPHSTRMDPAHAAQRGVRIPVGEATLDGDLVRPASARGLVLFVHGSGSSRHSVRNRAVAAALNQRQLTTLLFDLLTADEDRDASARFDVAKLEQRLSAILDWAQRDAELQGLPIGLFGASTGAAAALVAAAHRPERVAAVVSRGGRPDLAGRTALARVSAPTLLIVGGADSEVLRLNREAMAAMQATVELVVIPGATHLFEEPGTLDQAASVAGDWFVRWLGPRAEARPPTRAAG